MSNRLSHFISLHARSSHEIKGSLCKRWVNGSAIMGSSLIGGMPVLVLPQEQILQKLGPVPVFTITDNKVRH